MPEIRLTLAVHERPDRPVDNWFIRWLLESLPAYIRPQLLVASAASTPLSPDVTTRLDGPPIALAPETNLWQSVVRAATDASGDWVALIASDIWPVHGWLTAMLVGLSDGPGSGAATGLLVEPDGRLVSAGGEITPSGEAVLPRAGSYDICAPELRRARVVGVGPMGFMLTHRELLLEASRSAAHAGASDSQVRFCRQLMDAGASMRYEPRALAIRSWASPATSALG